MTPQAHPRLVLCILDGFGHREADEGNAIRAARPAFYDSLLATYPHTLLEASGLAVGLPEGQMGNSEVGHVTIGAGRVVDQELDRITKSFARGTFGERPAWRAFARDGLADTGRLHLIGLVSPGGIHSHTDHLYGIIDQARRDGYREIFLHVLLDGRDTDPHGGLGYVRNLLARITTIGAGQVATVMGRYWGMDRDKRWNRTARAWNAIVDGHGLASPDPLGAIAASYDRNISDEFVEPVVMVRDDGRPVGEVHDGDSVFFWNFRADRARQLTWAFMEPAFAGWAISRRPRVHFLTMTPYDARLPHVPAVFAPEIPVNGLAEVFARHGIRNLRTAETEKYAHVTTFFNGGREEPLPHEVRKLVSSPKVATYDLKPEMSASEVADVVRRATRSHDYHVVIVNFANADMVGHTGVFPAAVQAVRTVDRLLSEIVPPSLAAGTTWIITADHGNCDEMVDGAGHVLTQHSLSQVPFIVADARLAGDHDRIAPGSHSLADIAPTILQLLGIPQPAEMTGRSILIGEQ